MKRGKTIIIIAVIFTIIFACNKNNVYLGTNASKTSISCTSVLSSGVKYWDFENQLLDKGHGGDWIVGSQGIVPVISSDHVHSGSYAVKFRTNHQSYMWIPHYCSSINNVSAWLYPTGLHTSGHLDFLFAGTKPPGTEQCKGIFTLESSGNIYVNNLFGGHGIRCAPYAVNTWINLEIADNHNRTCSFYVNNTLKLANIPYVNGAGAPDSFCIEVTGGTDQLYADDVQVNAPGPVRATSPMNLMATSGNRQILLSWQAPASNGGSPITNYKIYRGTKSGGENMSGTPVWGDTAGLATVGGNVTTWIDMGVTNGRPYYYEVRAVNAVGEGPLSSEATATPRANVTSPSSPQNLHATARNDQVLLAWQAPVNNSSSSITNYTIYRGISSGGETRLTTVGNDTTWTDMNVTNGQTFYYEVSAMNKTGEGTQSNEVIATPATEPGTPQKLVATGGNGLVLLAWQVPASNGGSPINSYYIYRGTSPGGETCLTIIGNITTFTDMDIVKGQAYYYEISAVNIAGEGNRTAEMRVVVHQPPVPRFTVSTLVAYINTPVIINDSSQGGDSLIIAWLWFFGDNSNSISRNATHVYTEPGNYTITLIVRDGNGLTSVANSTIMIVASTTRQGLMDITTLVIILLSAGVVIVAKSLKKQVKRLETAGLSTC